MYDHRVTSLAIEAASAKQGWALVYHTPAQIDEAIHHFAPLWNAERQDFIRPLVAAEQRFIQNERTLCALDYRYWLQYVHIIGWDKKDVIFIPNIAQEIILEIWGEAEAKGLAIICMLLKARQLGMTTEVELAVLHRFQFYPRTYAVVASADPDKTVEMAKMIHYAIQRQPWWLLPKATKISRGMPVEFGEINSTLAAQWGNQYHGVARGRTPNVFHLTEVSSWNNAEDDIDAALFKAMHATPDVFGCLESTAMGRNNWWHDEWQLMIAEYPAGRSLIRPIFLPWFVGLDIYPTPADLRARPVPRDWIPLDRTLRHAERARQAVLSNPLWMKHVAKGQSNWQMPREQMWYYEIERELAVKKKAVNKFLGEMPADDQEAFQNTLISVVDQDVILDLRERALANHPLGVYTVVGSTIHQTLVVPRSHWDLSQPIIPIRPADISRMINETYQFVPVEFQGYTAYDPTWKLFIWEWPKPGETYGVGLDTSDGIGQDWCVIEVFRKGDSQRAHAQVAEFASPYIKANQIWEQLLAIATFYSVYNFRAKKRTQCRVCIECKGNGEKAQDELKKRGWVNFHPWKRLDNRKRLTNDQVHKEGIFTNVWYRARLMDTLLTAVDEDSVDINSPWLVGELETLERDPELASARAAYGCHDDRVMSFGFPLESLTVDDRPGMVSNTGSKFRRNVPQYLPDAVGQSTNNHVEIYASYPVPLQARSDVTHRSGIPLERRPTILGQVGRSGGRYRLGSYKNPQLAKVLR